MTPADLVDIDAREEIERRHRAEVAAAWSASQRLDNAGSLVMLLIGLAVIGAAALLGWIR